ncbi:MAG: cytochrome c [Balneolaceae bacterium]
MKPRIAIAPLLLSIFLISCGGSDSSSQEASTSSQAEQSTQNQSGLSDFELEHGIGPVTEPLNLDDEIDADLAEQGRSIFAMKCEACHAMESRMVGPAQGDVTSRRSPEFIMNFILNPSGMTSEHPVGKELLQEYMTPMPFQNVSEEEARAVLEYFRQYAANK